MSGLICAEPATPSLAALREARASRRAAIRRRSGPVGAAVIVFTAILIGRSHPQPGLYGTSLVITIAACCFLGSLAALISLLDGLLFQVPSRLAMSRARPVLLTVLVASSVTLEWLQSSGPGVIGIYVAVAIVARAFPRRVSAVVFAACFAFFLSLALAGTAVWQGSQGGAPGFKEAIAIVPVYLMSLFAGRIRAQEAQEEQLLVELEESRAAELRSAALAERQRLAREMHDVLAHSLSGLVVQLEGARMLAASAPGDARLPEAVERAHRLAKSGLDEARQAIGMLRDDELPGPDRLAELAAEFTAFTGIPCVFSQAGEQRALSPAVRLALYRVAQEALTNARKHASPDQVDVRLEYQQETVTLAVEDTARQPVRVPQLATVGAAASGGYGLTGMRERAELLGGTLDAGPTESGFLVRLQVPA